jgi:hypothetical protein
VRRSSAGAERSREAERRGPAWDDVAIIVGVGGDGRVVYA